VATLEIRLAHTEKTGAVHAAGARQDASGVVQPEEHDRSYGVYVINHSLPIEVFVSDSEGP
jgi:hypothetical protein